MFIKIRDLELRKMEFDETLLPGAVDLGEEVEQIGPLRATGRAELVRESRGARDVVEDIRLVGSYSTKVEIRCARCLDPVDNTVADSFDLLYRPQGVDTRGEEASISKAETEIGYYRGEGLLLEDALKEQILLALPAKQLCSSTCKGLCANCGRNLNVESCSCSSAVTEPRWAALEEIRKKLESLLESRTRRGGKLRARKVKKSNAKSKTAALESTYFEAPRPRLPDLCFGF